jgi:hypothetical protein
MKASIKEEEANGEVEDKSKELFIKITNYNIESALLTNFKRMIWKFIESARKNLGALSKES